MSGDHTAADVPAVEIVGLAKRFARTWALRGVSLRVEVGETVCLLGPNGSGKSTLLKLVAPVLRPSRGRVRVFGEAPNTDAVRRRIGMLAHQLYLYRDLTALENLRYAALMYGRDPSEDLLHQSLTTVGLGAVADRLVRTFSEGMSRRLALARAVLHNPDLLLLDEPYSGLDAKGTDHVDGLLRQHHAAGRTTLLVTHLLERARALCRRVVTLDAGRITSDAPVAAAGSLVSGQAEAGVA